MTRMLRRKMSTPQRMLVNSESRFPALCGGFGCVAAETMIGGQPVAERAAGEVSTLFGEMPATAGYLKGRADLYRVVTESGAVVVATERHRFLTPSGWTPLRLVRSGALIAADESANGRDGFERLPGSRDRYFSDSRRDDGLRSPAEVVALDKLQQLRMIVSDGSARCLQCCVSLEHGPRACIARCAVPPPPVSAFLRPVLQDGCVLPLDQPGNAHQVHESSYRQRIAPLFRPVVNDESGSWCPCQDESREHAECVMACLDHNLEFEQSDDRYGVRAIGQPPDHSQECEGSASLTSTGFWDRVKSISYVKHGDFYDLHVPVAEHYSAGGLWHHNSGKTEALIQRAMRLKCEFPENDIGYYLPTYDLVRRVAFPRFSEFLDRVRIPYAINKADNVLSIPGRGQIIFRTMDNPDRITSFEVGDSLVDELDTLKTDDARRVWQQIIARNRQKKPHGARNTVAVGTTPEGFRFVYEQWHKKKIAGYELIRSPTSANLRNLPADYIESLSSTYPPNLLAAYLEGEFVNLTSGSVYPEFSREHNGTTEQIREREPLHIGMDFNVGQMAAVIHVLRDNQPYALDEITGGRDTPSMIVSLRERFKGHGMMIYPDASGQARKSSNASISDVQLLKDAGFTVCVNATNPFVRDRVLAVNNQILDASGSRHLRVNIDKCPQLTEALEQQAYDKNGEPEKGGSADLSHVCDALGYQIVYRFPVVRRTAYQTSMYS